MEKLREEKYPGISQLPDDKTLTNSLYHDNYSNAGVVFRPFAAEYLKELQK